MATIESRYGDGGYQAFRAKVRLKGQQPVTATFHRRTDAVRWAQKVETELRYGRYFGQHRACKVIFAEVANRYEKEILPFKAPSTQVLQRHQLQKWKEQIGSFPLSAITPELIGHHRDKLLNDPVHPLKPATVLRRLNVLSHLFSIAVREWRYIPFSPMSHVTKPRDPRGKKRFLERDELERLLNAVKRQENPYLYPIVLIALTTGARKSEIMHFRVKDINFLRGFCEVLHTKNGDSKTLPLTQPVLVVLKALCKTRSGEELVFPGQDGLKPFHIRKAWERARKEAEIKNFRFHDLRHTAASYLAMSGATLRDIAEILGHRTLSMVHRYSHESDEHKRQVVERMCEKFLGQITELKCSQPPP